MKEIKESNHSEYRFWLIQPGDVEGVNIGGILVLPKRDFTTKKLLTLFQFDKYKSKIKDINTGLYKQVITLEDSAQRIVVDGNLNEEIDGLQLSGQVLLLPMLPNVERVEESLKDGEMSTSMDSLQRECFTKIDKNNPYYRIDEQISRLIEYVTQTYNLDSKTNILGHSAMGLPAMRYAMLQPQSIDTLIIGGNADEVPTPFGENGKKLQYPFGTKDYVELFDKEFDIDSFSQIAFRYYIGEYEYVDPNLDGIRNDNYGTRRDGRPGTGDKYFAPQYIAEEYKNIYNPKYMSDYNFSVYERLKNVLEQYELAGLDMKYIIYSQDCHTPITAADLKDAQFNDGMNFSNMGSKIISQLLEKIIRLEEYAISEPITEAKKQYTQATHKIFYNKESNDRQDRVNALIDLENEYSKFHAISMKSVVSNAITKGITTEDVVKSDNEEHRRTQENQIKGVTKDD